MVKINPLDQILDTPCKLAILRVFAFHQGLRLSGRDMAARIGYSAPAAHDALKSLFECHLLDLEVIGKTHIYSLNEKSRLVQKFIRPMFQVEQDFQKDLKDFWLKAVKENGIEERIIALALYGSVSRKDAGEGSDVDIAVVARSAEDAKKVQDVVIEKIAQPFFDYFGAHVDVYVKQKKEFIVLRQNKRPPVEDMMRSYVMFYGKDLKEI